MTGLAETTVTEVAVAGLLHDIGKLLQRAHGGQGLPQAVRDRAGDVLPQHQGRPTHWHALWSDLFFDLCGGSGADALPWALPWPDALDRMRVRNLAVFHHAPLQDYRTAPHLLLSELVTRADRLAAGQERKAKDAEADTDASDPRRRAYLETPLKAIVSAIRLEPEAGPERRHPPATSRGSTAGRTGAEAVPERWHPPASVAPDAILPAPRPDGARMAEGYRDLWQAFRDGWSDLCTRAGGDAAGFEEGLLSLSERTLWAVPSSIIDEPDVSLHDHARAVAAFAAALYRFHEAAGSLAEAEALRDGSQPRFRFLVGDLSGLQRTLFRLRSEGVAGLAKLLRGRSLRFELIADAATRRALDAFGMPMSAALQVAGGRFLLLVPDLADATARLDRLRAEADDWFACQYAGDLALGLALSDPFAPWDLMPRPDETSPEDALKRARAVRDGLGLAIETAKLRQLEDPAAGAVLAFDYPAGDCPACGVRPAGGTAALPLACGACAAETEAGQRLPHARAVVVGSGAGDDRLLGLDAATFNSIGHQASGDRRDRLLGLDYLLAVGAGGSEPRGGRGWRWLRHGGEGPAPLRAGPAFVARFAEGDDERYAARARSAGVTLEGANEIKAGDIKTFECLALDALETDGAGRPLGRPMLALLKGDVDRLGRLFAQGLGRRWSVARSAALSRMIDGYFRLRLPHLLESRFRESYTLYAGGDDFALVLPWRQGFALADALAADFRAFAGDNRDLTFSIGIALFDARTPVSIAAREAEARLEAAKDAGRNRVCAIEPGAMTWDDFARALAAAERFNLWLRDGTLATGALYRLLALDDARRRISAGRALAADYGWMGKLGYHLARLRPARGEERLPPEVAEACRALFGIGPEWRPAGPPPPGARLTLTLALYRNR